MGTEEPAVTAHLARSAASYDYERIPPDVVLIAKSSILDWLGVALSGAGEPAARAVAEVAYPPAAGPDATVLARAARASPADAARINGTAGHVLDFDDVLTAFDGHPTAPILPSILAIAEVERAGGRDLVTALVAGIETQTRINRIVTPSHYRKGFHTTASIGVFGAATAAARLLRLGPERTVHALGLAATAASGLKVAFGSWGKSLQVGRAAAEGLHAALLARDGAVGPAEALTGAQGFASTHADAADIAGAMSAVGDPWYCRQILYKFHASCYGTHSSVEALLRLRPGLAVDDIADLELCVAPMHVGMCTRHPVETPLDAKFSLAFTAAMALVLGDVGERSFTAAVLAREDLRELAAKVRVTVDPARPFTCTAVHVTLRDGTCLREAVDVGEPAAPDQLGHQWDRLETKFRTLAAPVVGASRADALVALVAGLDALPHIDRLTGLLGQHPAASLPDARSTKTETA
ncbi:MmgE/PrpD family protein [Spirillospora sp. NPDC127506]